MALPAATGTEGTPAQAAGSILQIARYCRTFAVAAIAECDANALNLHKLVGTMLPALAHYKTRWPALAATPGVLAELQRQYPAKNLVQADITNAGTAINTLISYIEDNCPTDNGDFILSLKMLKNDSGQTQERIITNAASNTAFKAALVTFRDAFDGNA